MAALVINRDEETKCRQGQISACTSDSIPSSSPAGIWEFTAKCCDVEKTQNDLPPDLSYNSSN
jgi:hypothetical protein